MRTSYLISVILFAFVSTSFSAERSQKLVLNIANRSINLSDKGITLNVPVKYQNTAVWCWAATTAMVVEYYNHYVIQDFQILSNYFSLQNRIYGGGDIDCRDQRNLMCFRTGYDFEIVAIYNQFQISAAEIYRAPNNFNEIANYLNRTQAPLVAKLQDPISKSGHVVTVIGYEESDNTLYVNDPLLPSTIRVNFNDLVKNYHGMQWTASFLPVKNPQY